MPSYGDLFIDLKDKKGILPAQSDYKHHVFDWVKTNIFHKESLTEDEDVLVKKFADHCLIFPK